MDMLHAKYIKIVTEGGDLSAATEMPLESERVALTITPEIAEHILSTSPIPKERYRIATNLGLKGVFGNAALEQVQMLIGGSITNNVLTRGQGVETVAKYDIEVGVVRPSDGGIVKHTLSKMQFVAAVEKGFETKKKSYLPFEAVATADSELVIDNS